MSLTSIPQGLKEQDQLRAPWDDWDTQATEAKKYWSAILPKLFYIEAQEENDPAAAAAPANVAGGADGAQGARDEQGERKLSSFNKAIDKTSNLLSEHLEQGKSICEQVANIIEFINITSKQYKHFNADGEEFHFGYGDFAPKYSYEIPRIKSLFAANKLGADEIMFIFKKMNSLFTSDLYECGVYEAGEYGVDMISDFIATSFEINSKLDCALKLSLIAISAEITGNDRFVTEFFTFEAAALETFLQSPQDWCLFLNAIDANVITKLVRSASIVLYNGLARRVQTFGITENIVSTEAKANPSDASEPEQKVSQTAESASKTSAEAATAADGPSGESVQFQTFKLYFDWLQQKFSSYQKDALHAACIIQGVIAPADTALDVPCAQLVVSALSKVLDEPEMSQKLVTTLDIDAVSSLVAVLARNHLHSIPLLKSLLTAMLDHLGPSELYQFLEKQRKRPPAKRARCSARGRSKRSQRDVVEAEQDSSSGLLALIYFFAAPGETFDANASNSSISSGASDTPSAFEIGTDCDAFDINLLPKESAGHALTGLMNSIVKRMLIAGFTDGIDVRDGSGRSVGGMLVMGKMCDLVSARVVSGVLRRDMSSVEFEGVKQAFLACARVATNCYKFDDILNYVECFGSSVVCFEIASEAMKCARNTECSLQFYQKSMKMMADQIVAYERGERGLSAGERRDQMKEFITGMADKCEVSGHFRDSVMAAYFLENVVKEVKSYEVKQLCEQVVQMCQNGGFWHDRLLNQMEKENVGKMMVWAKDVLEGNKKE